MFRKISCIKNLEVSSVCNLACPYCPCSGQGEHRQVGLMEWPVFEKALEWLRVFVANGTQQELNLFGVGEPFLHPRYVEMVRRCREIMPRYLSLRLNTNGLLAEEDLIRDIIDAGADAIDLTDHEALASTKALRIFRKLGPLYPHVKFGYSRDGVINPNNWGGLIDWVPTVDHPRYPCPWLTWGQVMVMSNGDVTRCCQDAHARGVLGTVFDDLAMIDHTPFIQCRTCHEDLPAGMEPWKSLSETNPYLKDPKERQKWLRLTVESSAAVEGVRIPKIKGEGA
jgi:hypothetical protein